MNTSQIQNTYQNSGYILPFIETVNNHEDDFTMVGFGDFFEPPENTDRKTQESAQPIFSLMEKNLSALTKENNDLRNQLISAQESIHAMRGELDRITQNANASIAEALAAQETAVQNAIQEQQSQVTSAKKEAAQAVATKELYKDRLKRSLHHLMNLQKVMDKEVDFYDENNLSWEGRKLAERIKNLIEVVIKNIRN